MIVNLIIPGKPVGKGRPRFRRIGKGVMAYTPETTIEYEKRIRELYIKEYGKENFENKTVSIEITAFFSPTKSTPKKQKLNMLKGYVFPAKKPDADKIAKIVLDALNGVAYEDDSQVINLSVQKRYSEEARVFVHIEELTIRGDEVDLAS